MHYVVKNKKKFKVILFLCFFLKSTEIWRETENIVHFLAFSLPTKGADEQIVTAIAISSGHCVTDVVSLWGRFWLPYSSKMCHLFQRDHSVLKWWWFVSVAILLPFTQIPWISACVSLCELTVGWRSLLQEWARLQHSSGEASMLFFWLSSSKAIRAMAVLGHKSSWNGQVAMPSPWLPGAWDRVFWLNRHLYP